MARPAGRPRGSPLQEGEEFDAVRVLVGATLAVALGATGVAVAAGCFTVLILAPSRRSSGFGFFCQRLTRVATCFCVRSPEATAGCKLFWSEVAMRFCNWTVERPCAVAMALSVWPDFNCAASCSGVSFSPCAIWVLISGAYCFKGWV